MDTDLEPAVIARQGQAGVEIERELLVDLGGAKWVDAGGEGIRARRLIEIFALYRWHQPADDGRRHLRLHPTVANDTPPVRLVEIGGQLAFGVIQ